ncbi:MAG: hypothetical protein FJW30_22315 [Acidobacteria bacterium]|nr:hypothetical protein [Acidobacteriota bacterium]
MIWPHWVPGIPVRSLSLALIGGMALAAAPGCEGEARALRTKFTPAARTKLEVCAAGLSAGPAAAAAQLAQAVTLIEGQGFAAALALLDKAKPRLGKIDDYVSYFRAQALAGLERHAEAAAALEPVYRTPGGSPVLGRAALLAAKSLGASGATERAVQLLRTHEAALPQPQGDMALAELSNSAEYFGRVFFRYPASEEAGRAGVQWKAMGAPGATFENFLLRIERATSGQAAGLRADLASAGEGWSTAQKETALIRTWSLDVKGRRYADVRRALAGMKIESPAADAERTWHLYQAGRGLKLDADREAAFRRLAMHHNSSPWYLQALLAEAYLHLLENEHQKYEPLYRTCVEKFEREAQAPFCHWKLTWSAYLRRRAGAEEMLRDHLERFPQSEKANAALYFLGRLAERGGKAAAARPFFEEAARRFPNTYYALISAERMTAAGPSAERPVWLTQIRWPNRAPLAPEPPTAQARRDRAALLRLAALDSYVEQELRHGARESAVPIHLATDLAEFMTAVGQADKGLRYIKGLLPGYLFFSWEGAGERFWRHAFPLPFVDDLGKYARENNVDPFVVAGLVRQESEFNPNVVSRSNAYGLTQILPGTGRELSRRVGMRGFSTAMLFDPAVNLRLGTFYMKTMLASFGGRWEDVLAGYNAGPSRAVKWRRWADYSEQAEFIETIPFDETRDYVQSVLRNAAVYRRLYARDIARIKLQNDPKPAVAQTKRALPKRAHR